MEAKKNPSKDLSLQRNKFFLIGLSISISLAITAFEWRTVKVKRIVPDLNPIETGILLTVPITTIEPPAAPQSIQKIEPRKIEPVNVVEIIAVTNETPVDEVVTYFGTDIPTTTAYIIPEKPEETEEITVFPEKQPEPINGFKFFYEQLGKNIKYPIQAKHIGTEGKVFVEFIVNRNGEASDLKIIRGIGSGCDEEAMRVLALTKWEPGKQRGKPVRVKMVLPISFMLSH
jgi:periplasmic protein TonB